MNASRRKLILGFSIFPGLIVAAITGVLAYAAHQAQLEKYGDIFDRIVSQQTQTWIIPMLIVIAGISAIGILIFIGLFIVRGKETASG